jgi:hypothetical protein
MNGAWNQEVVNDLAKLIMHRLIARTLARDPSLVERAKVSNARAAERLPNRSFVQEWRGLLAQPVSELRMRLVSRSEDMTRLRLSSPFVIADGVDFTDQIVRRRIWAAARRLAARESPLAQSWKTCARARAA